MLLAWVLEPADVKVPTSDTDTDVNDMLDCDTGGNVLVPTDTDSDMDVDIDIDIDADVSDDMEAVVVVVDDSVLGTIWPPPTGGSGPLWELADAAPPLYASRVMDPAPLTTATMPAWQWPGIRQ